MVAHYEAEGHLPHGPDFVKEGDLDLIATYTDFLGVNYYTRHVARDEARTEEAEKNAPQEVFPDPPEERTEMGWEVYPQGLYDLLNRIHFEYAPPKLYVTENGCSYLDGPDEEGRVTDERRIDYLWDHVAAVHGALENGVSVAGYFVWSLLDNFEWERGYTQRFGIVYVDYETQQRYLKDSAYWYRDVIAASGLDVDASGSGE